MRRCCATSPWRSSTSPARTPTRSSTTFSRPSSATPPACGTSVRISSAPSATPRGITGASGSRKSLSVETTSAAGRAGTGRIDQPQASDRRQPHDIDRLRASPSSSMPQERTRNRAPADDGLLMAHLTEEQLGEYAFDPDALQDRREMEAHLADCPQCSSSLTCIRSIEFGLADPDAWEIAERDDSAT